MQTPKHLQNQQQQGFVLALALLLMLFIGVIVISSAQKTGVETRTAQSEAPIATMQAAAEEGFFQLRRHVALSINEGGICKEESLEDACDCVNDIGLDQLFSTIDHPSLFRTSSGTRDVYWWFDKENDRFKIKDTTVDSCILNAHVFVGKKSEHPGPFMSAEITISMKNNGKTPNVIDGIFDGKDFSSLSADDLNKFYDDEFLNSLDPNIFSSQKLAHGGTLDPSTLEEGKINVIVLNGAVNIGLSSQLQNKPLLIISNKFSTAEISSGKGGGKAGGASDDTTGINMFSSGGSGQGAGAGGVTGLVIAPEARVYTNPGTPKINMNLNVAGCGTGNHQTCFHESGGSSFNDQIGTADLVKNIDDDSDDLNNKSITVDSLNMQFDY